MVGDGQGLSGLLGACRWLTGVTLLKQAAVPKTTSSKMHGKSIAMGRSVMTGPLFPLMDNAG